MEEYEDSNDITICVISHGGFIQMLFRSVFQLSFEPNHFVATVDGGYHVWQIDNDKKRIQLELFPGID